MPLTIGPDLLNIRCQDNPGRINMSHRLRPPLDG